MKPKMKRSDLSSKEDIWNAVVDVVSEYDLSSVNSNPNLHEAFIVFQYYSELESGGHESLFTWFEWYIKEIGIEQYVNELSRILEKIGAHHYAAVENKYCEKLWRLYAALENREIEEEEFYDVVEKANEEYYKLNDRLAELLEAYFITIHTDLIEVVDA